MLRSLTAAALVIAACSVAAEARPKASGVIHAHPDCNVLFPCEGVAPSARGELVVKAMGGLGVARQVYRPRAEAATIVAHPPGCPRRQFCGCGAAVRVFGSPVRSLWLAASWFKFPRAAPAPGMVAVRWHHVFVLEAHLEGSTWRVYDANSGRRMTRIHPRSIAGYVIVNPRGPA
jgi:hypothetical protein